MPDRYNAYLTELERAGRALLAAAATAPEAPVAACPGWDNAALAAHVGRIWRYVSRQVRSTERLDGAGRPPDGTDPISWAGEGLDALLLALTETGAEALSWNWSDRRPAAASFWFRRMAQETAVHGWDAESALGSPTPIASWLAADGIEEVATMWLARRRTAQAETVTGTAHWHASDPAEGEASEWFIELGAAGAVSARHAHEKGDAVLRGRAEDILLRLWGRPSAVEEFGDPTVLGAMRAE